jgi:hypothetical protein
MRSKGIINVIELAIVIVTLFVSFSVFFPGTSYRNKWDDAYGMLKARDAVLALERTGKLHEYAFDSTKMGAFLNSLFAGSNVIVWHSVSGGIKEETRIACDCPADVVAWLNGWAGSTVLNERNISIVFCKASIDPADACFASSGALLVWKYKPLQPYDATLTDYVSKGGGIIEVMNFTAAAQVNNDSVQQKIFSLNWVSLEKDTGNTCEFARAPRSTSDIIYEPYKYFHHIPITLKISNFSQPIDGCQYNGNGTIVLKSISYEFDTCNASSALFDTNGIGGWDTNVTKRQTISINGSKIMLNYVNSVSSISVSFNSSYASYVFENFLGYGSGSRTIADIEPADSNQDRVLVAAVAGTTYYPAVILNTYGSGRVAWTQEPGAANYGDDEKALLMSLLLWAANKEPSTADTGISSFRAGYMTSYINVKNYDMFEIYKLNIGIGYPV